MADTIKVSEEARKLLEELKEKTGKSLYELASEAIVSYYRGVELGEGKDVKSITPLKPIILRYRAWCYRCKTEIPQNELAFYQRITFTDNTFKSIVLCEKCASSEEALAKSYVEKRKLEKTIQGLRKEANRLADQVIELQNYEELAKLKVEVERELRDLAAYFRAANSPYEALQKIEQFNERLGEVLEKFKQVSEFIQLVVIPKLQKYKLIARGRKHD